MEPTKSGVLPDDVLKLAQSIIWNAQTLGYPAGDSTPKDQPEHWFEALAALRDDLEQEAAHATE